MVAHLGDTLTGGSGTDQFKVVRTLADNGASAAHVTDFEVASETLTIEVNSRTEVSPPITYRDGADGLEVLIDGDVAVVIEGVTQTDAPNIIENLVWVPQT